MAKLDKVQKNILKTLDEIDTPATQKTIRENVGCPKSTLSNKLRTLEGDYVLDQSGTFENSKKYVLSEEVDIDVTYRWQRLMDTRTTLFGIQIVFFALLIFSMIFTLNISRSMAYIIYGSFLLGVLPPAIIHIYERARTEDMYNLIVSKSD